MLALAVGVSFRPAPAPGPAPVSVTLMRRVQGWIYIVQAYDSRHVPLELGSGVRLQGGVIVTNWHVVSAAASITVDQGTSHWPAVIQRCKRDHDVCLLSAAGLPAGGAVLRSRSTAESGEPVFAVGAPEGLDGVISSGLAAGIRPISGVPMLVVTAATSSGSSGSGVFDAQGALLGIVRDQVANGEDLTLAVPAAQIAALLRPTAH